MKIFLFVEYLVIRFPPGKVLMVTKAGQELCIEYNESEGNNVKTRHMIV